MDENKKGGSMFSKEDMNDNSESKELTKLNNEEIKKNLKNEKEYMIKEDTKKDSKTNDEIEDNNKKEKDKEKKEKKRIKISTIVSIIGLIFIFILFFILASPKHVNNKVDNQEIVPESYKYNDFLFQKGTFAWYSKIKIGDKIYDISFIYGPKEVDWINVSKGVNDIILKADKIYITTEPDYPSIIGKAQVEISKITSPRTSSFGVLNIPTINTVTYIPENRKGIVNYPEITCKNATLNTTIIYLLIGNKTEIYNSSRCVIVEGSNATNVVKAADRLIYNLLGIIRQ